MKKVYDKEKRVKLSVTIGKNIVKHLNEKTSNRSALINWILKKYFSLMEDVSKIKL